MLMRSNYKPNFQNRPPHKVRENGYYFITVRTIEGQWFLQPDQYKEILRDIIREKTKKFSYPLVAYSIMNNHYHLIIDVKVAGNLSKFMNEVNGASSRAINKADHVIDRKIWWNYFETPINSEKFFYNHLNYIHQNPIKHGLSKKFGYKFSSYSSWEQKKGKEYLDDCFSKYPIIDFKMLNDEF